MRNIKLILVFTLFVICVKTQAQSRSGLTQMIVSEQRITLKVDSLNRPIFRTDSVDLVFLLVFNHLTSEIGELNLSIGKEKGEGDLFKKRINIVSKDGKYYQQTETGKAAPLNYGKNLILRYRIKSTENLNWASLSYKNAAKTVTSEKISVEVKNNKVTVGK